MAPSILSADFARLGAQVQEVLDAGARVIHVDVMDGHFVPPITIGPLVVAALREQVEQAGAVLDVHLMIERPERQIPEFSRRPAHTRSPSTPRPLRTSPTQRASCATVARPSVSPSTRRRPWARSPRSPARSTSPCA